MLVTYWNVQAAIERMGGVINPGISWNSAIFPSYDSAADFEHYCRTNHVECRSVWTVGPQHPLTGKHVVVYR